MVEQRFEVGQAGRRIRGLLALPGSRRQVALRHPLPRPDKLEGKLEVRRPLGGVPGGRHRGVQVRLRGMRGK